MMAGDNRPLRLKAAPATSAAQGPRPRNWRVLVVDDDDEEIHTVTALVLGRVRYKDRGIELLAAYSAAEACAVLKNEPDIAVVLLDVVMENDDAGLDLVRVIREEIGNRSVRIILRTGQPGHAPEEQVIIDYDINDYKAKSELTSQKLFTSLIATLRAYETLSSLEKTRLGLEKILDSTGMLFQVQSMQQFASGILTQLSAFLGCRPSGLICAQSSHGELQLLAAAGDYSECVPCELAGTCEHGQILSLVRRCLKERRNQITEQLTIIFIDSVCTPTAVALSHGGWAESDEVDQRLLEVFASKISIALANAVHYQKMIHAETAATTDFLTGLHNRRHLLRLGAPIVSEAFRAGTHLAVAMLDIDHFKRINDEFGHDAGDAVLVAVSALMRNRFRASDIIARIGGEEFCIILPTLKFEAAYRVLDDFRLTLEQHPFEFEGRRLPVTISVGVTTRVTDNLDVMVSFADESLYRAKQLGRNRVVME